MPAELGHFTLILALAIALVQATLPLYGAAKRDYGLMALDSFAPLYLVLELLRELPELINPDLALSHEFRSPHVGARQGPIESLNLVLLELEHGHQLGTMGVGAGELGVAFPQRLVPLLQFTD